MANLDNVYARLEQWWSTRTDELSKVSSQVARNIIDSLFIEQTETLESLASRFGIRADQVLSRAYKISEEVWKKIQKEGRVEDQPEEPKPKTEAEEHEERYPPTNLTQLMDHGLLTRTYHIYRQHGIDTVEHLMVRSREDLIKLVGVNKASIDRTEEALAAIGKSLRPT